MINKNFIDLPAWQNENIWLIKYIGLGWALLFAVLTYFQIDFKILFLLAYIFFLVSSIYFPRFLVKAKIIHLSFQLKNIFLKINNITIAFLLYLSIIGFTAIFFKSYLKRSYKFIENFSNKSKTKVADKKNSSFFKEENKYADLVSKYC